MASTGNENLLMPQFQYIDSYIAQTIKNKTNRVIKKAEGQHTGITPSKPVMPTPSSSSRGHSSRSARRHAPSTIPDEGVPTKLFPSSPEADPQV